MRRKTTSRAVKILANAGGRGAVLQVWINAGEPASICPALMLPCYPPTRFQGLRAIEVLLCASSAAFGVRGFELRRTSASVKQEAATG